MAFQLLDRVRELNTVSGTGAFTTGGAVPGFQKFSAVMAAGDTTWLVVFDPNSFAWEVSLATFTGTQMQRGSPPLASSANGATVSFSGGQCQCFMDIPASFIASVTAFETATNASLSTLNSSVATLTSSLATTNANVAATNVTVATKASKIELRGYGIVPCLRSANLNYGLSSAGDPGGTSRILYFAPMDMTAFRVVVANYSTGTTGSPQTADVAPPNPITVSCSYEDQFGNLNLFAFNGAPTICLQPGTEVASDSFVNFTYLSAAGNGFWVRTWVQIALPPATFTVTGSVLGGTLSANTRLYKVTADCGPQGESGTTAEVSVTNTGTTSSNKLVVIGDSRSAQVYAWNVYVTTGSTGTEVFLAKVPAGNGGVLEWIDDGTFTAGSATPPTQGQQYPIGPSSLAYSGQGNNYVQNSGSGTGQLLTAGVAWRNNTVAKFYAPRVLGGIPFGGLSWPVVSVMGDSIASGDLGSTADYGYLNQALYAANIPWWHNPNDGESAASLNVALPYPFRYRGRATVNCSIALHQYGTNDIFVQTYTLAQVQAACIANWVDLINQVPGMCVVQPTILPRTTGSFSSSPGSNQSQIPGETVRQNFNTWLRQGAPMTIIGGVYTAVANGTAGAVYAGQTGHPLALSSTLFDGCANVEVNGSNVLTVNGGYWIVNGTGWSGFGGVHPTQALINLMLPSLTAGTAALQSYKL